MDTDTEQRLEIIGEVRVVTESSVWLIRDHEYCRLPRHAEQPRNVPSPDLADGRWHGHEGVWLVSNRPGEVRHVRLLPLGRPPGSVGVVTGVVEVIEREATSARRESSGG